MLAAGSTRTAMFMSWLRVVLFFSTSVVTSTSVVETRKLAGSPCGMGIGMGGFDRRQLLRNDGPAAQPNNGDNNESWPELGNTHAGNGSSFDDKG